MFGLFGDRKTKLEKRYKQLMDESYRLSHIDRKRADLKAAEAEQIRQQIESLGE